MKRIFALMLACAMTLSLVACGSKDKTDNGGTSAPTTQAPAFGKDLTAFYTEIMEAAEEGPFMMDLASDPEMLEVMYPGLKDVATKQLVVASPAMSAVATEFAFAEAANAADVETIKAIFQARIDAQVAGGAWYPETIEGWKNNSEIVVIDNYVCMFVCEEKAGMIDAFRTGAAVPTWAEAQGEEEFEDMGDVGIMDMPVEDGPAAFDPEPVPMPEVLASLALNKTDFTLKTAGATYKLKAEVTGTESPIVWASSDETVATVAENGTVTAVAPGTATVTATVDEMVVECIVRCTWEAAAPEQPAAPAQTASVDLNDFVMALATKHGENFAANANVVEFGMHNDMYPGIGDINTKQLVIYQPMMGAVVCEIALAEVADAADVAAVKAIFQARIDAQVAGGAWYPESIRGWQENSRIVTNGNYVMMIAWQFCEDAVADFNALF